MIATQNGPTQNGHGLRLLPALRPRVPVSLTNPTRTGEAAIPDVRPKVWRRIAERIPLSPKVKRVTDISDDDDAATGAPEAQAPAPPGAYATPLELATVHRLFSEWLLLTEDEHRYDQIDIAMAVIIAKRLPLSPLWAFLIASPSMGKTETIDACHSVDDTYMLSSLTPQTLASGWDREDEWVKENLKGVKGFKNVKEDASLLWKLTDKTVLMKDFTSVLTMHRDKRSEIFGQLREIYDGAYYSCAHW